jgi:hypothetical protein
MTLEDALLGIPLLSEHVEMAGLQPVHGDQDKEWSAKIDLFLHPSDCNSAIIENITADAKSIDHIDCKQIADGYQLTLQLDHIHGPIFMPLPPAATINTNEWRMWSNSPSLNEFGYHYLALYLAGNYARYYPDKWLHDVETSTPLALAIEELCEIAEWRVPWLSLCEMDSILYVPEV